MGTNKSKMGSTTKLKMRKKLSTSNNKLNKGQAPSNKKYISGVAILARPWEIVGEEPLEKWKKSQVAARFAHFPVCTKKPGSDQVRGHWYSDYCHDVTREKARSLIIYQPHGTATKYTLPYNSNNLLEKTLNEGTFHKVIQSTGGYLALYFTYRSLEDRTYGIIPLCNLAKSELLYFFVDKQVSYEPRGIAISPDSTMLCLLLSMSRGDQTIFEIQVYSKRPSAFEESFHGPTFEFEYEVPGLQPNKGCPKMMFDPRYHSSRLGIINVNSVQNIRVTHYFMVYDLKRKRPVTMPHENYIADSDDLDLLDASYSPDGAWVHALVGHVTPGISNKHMRSLWIINSDTLEIVRAIEIGHENIDTCFMNYLPVYSRCTRQMAMRHRKSVKLYKLPPQLSLKAQSRAVFLKSFTGDIERLDTTQDVINYLKLKPYR